MARIEITPSSQDIEFARNDSPEVEDNRVEVQRVPIAPKPTPAKEQIREQPKEQEKVQEQSVLTAQDILALAKFHQAKAMEFLSALG